MCPLASLRLFSGLKGLDWRFLLYAFHSARHNFLDICEVFSSECANSQAILVNRLESLRCTAALDSERRADAARDSGAPTGARNKAQAIPAPVQCLQSRHENPAQAKPAQGIRAMHRHRS